MTKITSILVIAIHIVACATAAISSDKQTAEKIYAKALEIVQHGDYKYALAHFRAACRRYNASALYWNDLGVTEMRMGELERARTRFVKALSLEPNYAIAHKNLNEVQAFMSISDQGTGFEVIQEKVTQEHIVQCPRLVSHSQFASEMSVAVGQDNHILRKPFVVGDAFALFNLSNTRVERVFNRQFLSEKYGAQRVDFYPHNMNEEQAHPYFLSLEPALRQLLYGPEEVFVGVDASEPGTYVQWNLDAEMWHDILVHELQGGVPTVLDDRRWTDICFAQHADVSTMAATVDGFDESTTIGQGTADATAPSPPPSSSGKDGKTAVSDVDVVNKSLFYLSTHWQMLLMGEQGAGMFNHQDTLRTASWQLQLVGSKKWHLCGPEQSSFLYKAGDVDLFNPDYARFPLLKNAHCFETTLHAGEMLYYPTEYWHQTMNLETPSISLSSTLVTALNHHQVAAELRKECAGAGRIFAPQARMCENLERCFAVWESMYGGATGN